MMSAVRYLLFTSFSFAIYGHGTQQIEASSNIFRVATSTSKLNSIHFVAPSNTKRCAFTPSIISSRTKYFNRRARCIKLPFIHNNRVSQEQISNQFELKPSRLLAPILRTLSSNDITSNDVDGNSNEIDFDSLMDMDIVLFSRKMSTQDDCHGQQQRKEKPKLELGAIQEDGTLSSLSAWTLESAFSDAESIEFLVDEEDRWLEALKPENIVIHLILDQSVISYGSRQVGGGKGPGNPHGEESELLYYVDRSILDDYNIDIVLKPELEILW